MTFDKLELGARFRFPASRVVFQKMSEREYYSEDAHGTGYRGSVRHADLTAVNPTSGETPYAILCLAAGEWSVWVDNDLGYVAASAEAAGKWLDGELAYQKARGNPEVSEDHLDASYARYLAEG